MANLTTENKELFISEAHEHLDALDNGLISLEKDSENADLQKELMRHSHTLKGIAATASFGEISNLAHSFEGMIENMKNHLSKGGFELLFGAVDELRNLVDLAETSNTSKPVNPLVDEVGELEDEDHSKDAELAKKPEMFQTVKEVKVRIEKLDKIMDLAGELTLNKLRLSSTIQSESTETTEAMKENVRLVDDLQYQVLQLRLTPIDHVFNRFPRMVRDLSKKLKKEVDLNVQGGDIELDRSVLDDLGEPLVHLLRNAIDHGIETKGSITLSATRMKDQVLVGISDTGSGINWDKVKEKQKAAGHTGAPEDYIFSGVSTADAVTEISGRGVGLSVVKRKVEELGGTIDVSSESGKGTTFTLSLPVSVAIIKALLVLVDDHTYAIPATSIERLVNLKKYEQTTQADNKCIVVDEQNIPLIFLSDVLQFSKKNNEKEAPNKSYSTAVLVRLKDKMVGLVISDVIVHQDIIVKPLTRDLKKKIHFNSVTILGDGQPVPILDVDTLADELS
jgi:two-component system chemotaxis sensor kinase CheA